MIPAVYNDYILLQSNMSLLLDISFQSDYTFPSHSFMQFVCMNVHMNICVYKSILIYINIYILSYIYNPCRFLILIPSFHLINFLWSLKFIWKYTMSPIFPIILRFLFPFLISILEQKTMLSLPRSRSQSFFLCAFRKNKGPSEMEDSEDKCENVITIENGIPCDPLDMKGGHINDAFVTEDERLTPLWRATVLLPPWNSTLVSVQLLSITVYRGKTIYFVFIILLL